MKIARKKMEKGIVNHINLELRQINTKVRIIENLVNELII
tara:strand:+ start:345 stop:464 length:120 start_codon:yes stop_codon:yes gene_type:complete